ncbi:MAG: TIM barrel protein [Candidatus Latescibacterota bacterium]
MKLSLSGRLIEIEYRFCERSVPEFMRFAHECGYEAVELRATQITTDTTPEEAVAFRRVADELGIGVSCVIPPRAPEEDAGLGQLEEFADIVKILGCDTLKTWSGQVGWIREACDMLGARGMTIVAQTHTGIPFSTVASCLNTLGQVNRTNFGLQYDPANLFEAQAEYGEEAIGQLGKYLHQLSVQNIALAEPDEPNVWEHEGRHYKRCLLGDPDGLDFASVFRGLRTLGFDGYVTVNEPKPTITDVGPFARKTAEELRKLLREK